MGKLLQCGLVHIGALGHQQEGTAPPGAVNAIVLQQEAVLRRRADAALCGDALRRQFLPLPLLLPLRCKRPRNKSFAIALRVAMPHAVI